MSAASQASIECLGHSVWSGCGAVGHAIRLSCDRTGSRTGSHTGWPGSNHPMCSETAHPLQRRCRRFTRWRILSVLAQRPGRQRNEWGWEWEWGPGSEGAIEAESGRTQKWNARQDKRSRHGGARERLVHRGAAQHARIHQTCRLYGLPPVSKGVLPCSLRLSTPCHEGRPS